MQKAFALWANSVLGMITHWTRGQRAQKGCSTTQIGALRKIPCPDLARLDAAAGAFEDLAKLELRPTCLAHCDGNRQRIDEAVCGMAFPAEEVAIHNRQTAPSLVRRTKRSRQQQNHIETAE